MQYSFKRTDRVVKIHEAGRDFSSRAAGALSALNVLSVDMPLRECPCENHTSAERGTPAPYSISETRVAIPLRVCPCDNRKRVQQGTWKGLLK